MSAATETSHRRAAEHPRQTKRARLTECRLRLTCAVTSVAAFRAFSIDRLNKLGLPETSAESRFAARPLASFQFVSVLW